MHDAAPPPPPDPGPAFDPGPVAPAVGPADFVGGGGGGSYDPGPAAAQQQDPTVIIQQVETPRYGEQNLAVDSFGQYIVTGALAFGMAGAVGAAIRGFSNPGAAPAESAAAAYNKLPPLKNRWWPLLRGTLIAGSIVAAAFGIVNHWDTLAKFAKQPVPQTVSSVSDSFQDAASFVTGQKSAATMRAEKQNKYSIADRWNCDAVIGDKELKSRKDVPNLRIGNDAQMLVANPDSEKLYWVYEGDKIQGLFSSKFGKDYIVVKLAPRNSNYDAIIGATGKDACVIAVAKDLMLNKDTGQVFYQVPEAAARPATPAKTPATAPKPKT